MPARILPVLDLKGDHAVHAIAGARDHYQPLVSRLHAGSDPIACALAVRDRFGFFSLYLADLDAIAGRAPREALYRDLVARGFDLWVDAGVRTREDLAGLLAAGVGAIVVGLETVAGPEALAAIVADAGAARVVFSLDLRAGVPIVAAGSAWNSVDPIAIAEAGLAAGVRRVLLLDLARVGTGRGPGTLALLAELHAAHPAVELSAGGGVAGPEDVEALGRAGASYVLVGSALHDGRIGSTDRGAGVWTGQGGGR